MTKDQLNKLYQKLKDKNIDPYVILDMKSLPNSEIDFILNYEDLESIANLYLNSKKEHDDEIQKRCSDELLNIVFNAKGEEQAKIANDMMLYIIDKEVSMYYCEPDYQDKYDINIANIVSIIANANSFRQATYASMFIKYIISLEESLNTFHLEIASLIALSIGGLQAKYGYLISKILIHNIEDEKVVELVEKVTSTTQEALLPSILVLIKNNVIFELGMVPELPLKLLELTDNKLIVQAFSAISNIDNDIQESANYPYISQLMNIFYQEQISDFWIEFQKNPDMAIQYLSDDMNINLNTNISQPTLLRNKIKSKTIQS